MPAHKYSSIQCPLIGRRACPTMRSEYRSADLHRTIDKATPPPRRGPRRRRSSTPGCPTRTRSPPRSASHLLRVVATVMGPPGLPLDGPPCCDSGSFRTGRDGRDAWHSGRCSPTRWLGMSASRWVGMTGDGKGPAGGVGGALWCPGCRGGGRVVVVSGLRGRSACPGAGARLPRPVSSRGRAGTPG